jgi:UrcA family protein
MTQPAIRFIGLALALAASSMALADSSEAIHSRVVRFADLNLHSRDGAAAVYGRLSSAADTLCSLSWRTRSLGVTALMSAEVGQCKSKAIENAVKQIHAPLLTAFFLEKTQGKVRPVKVVQGR